MAHSLVQTLSGTKTMTAIPALKASTYCSPAETILTPQERTQNRSAQIPRHQSYMRCVPVETEMLPKHKHPLHRSRRT
jgi:hypothetical protein